MTRPALRLVLDQEKDTDARTADWPSAETTGLHIHLHIGTPDQQNARPTETSPPAASAIQGTSEGAFCDPSCSASPACLSSWWRLKWERDRGRATLAHSRRRRRTLLR